MHRFVRGGLALAVSLLLMGSAHAQLPGPNDDLTGTQYGHALVWLDGPIDFEATTDPSNPVFKPMTEVLLTNLGTYDLDGNKTGANGGKVIGKYGDTKLISINSPGAGFPQVNDVVRSNNDFRINPFGDSSVPARDALLWSAQTHFYYFVDDYRTRYLNDQFITNLALPANLDANLRTLQFRPDYELAGTEGLDRRATFQVREVTNATGLSLFPLGNLYEMPARSRGGAGASKFPLAHSFDREAVVNDYAGLTAFWVLGSKYGFGQEAFFGQGSSTAWQRNIAPVLNDAISSWVTYRTSGKPEYFQSYSGTLRTWSDRAGATPPGIPTYKGENVRNVMMFDNDNTSKAGVFPFSNGIAPGTASFDGIVGSDLASLYFGAVYYDIANEAGLGIHKTDLIVWKALSLITERVDDATGTNNQLPMSQYADKLRQAARELFPDTRPGHTGTSLYEQDIADVLVSRGIAIDGDSNFRVKLPAAVGASTGSFDTITGNGFGSASPDLQPVAHGSTVINTNGYHHADANAEYVAYQFYKHSKYGPLDKLILTDGTFTLGGPAGYTYNNDGTYFLELEDRELGNAVVLAPGGTLRWLRALVRADNEAEGYYVEDVSPLGFRVVGAKSNGFSFHVDELAAFGDTPDMAFDGSGDLIGTKTFRTSIVDPSLAFLGDASYTWTITDYLGNIQTGMGLNFDFTLAIDQPFSIEIARLRGGVLDSLVLRERVNDFARSGGDAFVFNMVPEPSAAALLVAAAGCVLLRRRDGAARATIAAI